MYSVKFWSCDAGDFVQRGGNLQVIALMTMQPLARLPYCHVPLSQWLKSLKRRKAKQPQARPAWVKRLVLGCLALTAWALTTGFSVVPIVLEAQAAGQRSSAQITVTNPNDNDLPVEITIQEVIMGETGKAKERRDATADFIILPPQSILKAGQARVFTLQYVGNADISESRYFEWAVDQVPITMPTGQNAVQIVYSISGILCVAPVGGKAAIEVVSTAIEKTEDGKAQPVLTLRNSGNAHAMMSQGVLRLSQKDAAGKVIWRKTVREQELEQLIGAGVLPALRTRDIKIPLDLPSAEGVVTADYSLPTSSSSRGRR